MAIRPLKRATGILTAIATLSLILAAHGQDRSPSKDLQDEILTLKQSIAALQASQQKLADRLDRIDGQSKVNYPAVTGEANIPPMNLSVQGGIERGEKDAHIAIVEYADFECPYCQRFAQDVYPKIIEKYVRTGKVRYIYRDLPLSIHAHAMLAARSVHCAAEQKKSWEMHEQVSARARLLGLVLLCTL